ncbi:MAG TPA: FkbM family methyltransferase, partial [Kamptonema sp.]|nr:FkbM family methyltransferase [Kamptonema sp.]
MSLPPQLEKLIRKTPIEGLVRKFLRKAGFDIIRAPIPEVAILSNYDINLILDVGANIGQYAMRKRSLSYTGKIVSFEPISSVFAELTKNAASDPRWQTVNTGLGNYDG